MHIAHEETITAKIMATHPLLQSMLCFAPIGQSSLFSVRTDQLFSRFAQ
jgi:hypothetical protein